MITDQAYVLHRKPYKESSELLKILGKNCGVIDLISKGSRNPKSKLKGQLQPFIESVISYSGKSNLKTLIHIEQTGINQLVAYLNHVSMLYCNELLLLLNLNDDHHTEIFTHYSQAVQSLKMSKQVSFTLRKFEWQLCCLMGYQISVPETFNATDFVQFCPVNGLVLSKQHKRCTAQTVRLFINGDRISSSQLKGINHLMRSIIDHMVHGKTIQCRALLTQPLKPGPG